jgi:hypothetical protein
MAASNRRYSKAQKVAAVIQAEMTTPTAAALASGIPETNIRRWKDDPELAQYGAKTREEIAEGARMIAALAVDKIAEAIRNDKFEPRDLLIAFGLAVDKSQLLGGQATTRTETLTDGMDDHERQALRKVLAEAISE